MSDTKELSITLTVKQNSKEIEHEVDVAIEGYNKSQIADIQDIINEDVDFFVEDLRRRVGVIR